jgi:hypothetical protein
VPQVLLLRLGIKYKPHIKPTPSCPAVLLPTLEEPNDFFTFPIRILYGGRDEMNKGRPAGQPRINMGMYQTSRPMIVDALQCTEAKTIATDLGFINVKRGEWVICGEDGECYVVDDDFFQRTFVSLPNSLQIPIATKPDLQPESAQAQSAQVRTPTRACLQRKRVRLIPHSIHKRGISKSR